MKTGNRRRILEARSRRIRTKRKARGLWEGSTARIPLPVHIRCEDSFDAEERTGERITRALPGRFPGACPYCARGRRIDKED